MMIHRTPVTWMDAFELQRNIDNTFKASNHLENTMCHLRATKALTPEIEKELEALNAQLSHRLIDLITERNYREGCKAKQVAA